jgi:hypothetical protein
VSAVKARGGSWTSANYDKLALLIALALLLLSVATLFLILNSKRSSINEASWDRVPSNPAVTGGINTDLVTSIALAVTHPVSIDLEHRRLSVGPLRVSCVGKQEPIAYDATKCPFCGAIQPSPEDIDKLDNDGDGMPDIWEKKYGLNPLDPSDAAIDSDGDGFTNLEEFKAGTDPKDPASKPDPMSKLRVSRINVEPFKLRFLGVSKLPSGSKYQLNLRNLDRTYFATNGQAVEGVKVTGFDETDPRKPVLILQQGDRTLRLVLNELISEDSYSAVLVSLVDKKPFKILINQAFKLSGDDYNVVDITRSAVVIRDTKNGRETTLQPLADDERARLRGGDAVSPEMMRRPGQGREGENPTGSPFDFPLR